jgi:beta-N-acetylhexosaminidase
MIRNTFWFFLLCYGIILNATAQTEKEKWVDSVFNQLSQSEKIGQLILLQISSHLDENKWDDLADRIKNQSIGGLLFTNGHPVKQAKLTNSLQSAANVPLLISQHALYGLGMQLDSTIAFPGTLAQGAIASDSMIYSMGKEIARQLKILGVHMNLAPSANLTHKNEFIYRNNSFGENRNLVANKSLAYLKGMQSEGLLSCTHYFPIKGITITDVQKGIPVLHPYVDSIQAYPFGVLFKNGVDAVMPGPTEFPLFYEKKKSARKNKFSSEVLSTFFTGDWIKKQMGFNGLVIVDIQSLENSSTKLSGGDAELFAFQAGNDILITSENPNPAIRKIKKLLKKESHYKTQLDNSVKKILAAKYDAGLSNPANVNLENLMLRLNTAEARALQRKMFYAAATVVKNENNVLPLLTLENKKIALVIAGDIEKENEFKKVVSKYVHTTNYSIKSEEDIERLDTTLRKYDIVITALTSSLTTEVLEQWVNILTRDITDERQIIIADLGCAPFTKYAQEFPVIITGYTSQPEMMSIIPQIIFGGLPGEGSLSVSMGDIIAGSRIKTKTLGRFSYTAPEDAGMDSKTLQKIEAVAQEAIAMGATPGCHVFVAKDGKVVYEKSFGHFTYEKQIPVTDSTIYDLASVTKVMATLQTVMFMHDRGVIDINKKASYYLPELRNSNKKDFTIKDILMHQAGLWPFLPFWAQTMRDSIHLPEYYSNRPSLQYPYVVSDKLYATSSMRDSLWQWVIRSKIREKPARTPYDYKYSDFGFYIMHHLAEKMLNQPMEDFLEQNLYEPLGSYTTGFLPLLRFPIKQVAPTENDKLFRKSLLIGTVHDQGAAMHGGIAGHAGLFSNANDLAKLGQMLLQEGYYGGYQYYKPETVRLFAKKQFETSRRGLGWDKPILNDWNSPTSVYASPKTFGHTGFTGTCIWIDPEFNLVYVFLSNRVHPQMTNNKLLNANIRPRIQDVIYQAIFNYCKTHELETFTKNSAQ